MIEDDDIDTIPDSIVQLRYALAGERAAELVSFAASLDEMFGPSEPGKV